MRGRRISKPADERAEDLRKAVNRSGFSESEVYSILYKWYGRDHRLFSAAPSTAEALKNLVQLIQAQTTSERCKWIQTGPTFEESLRALNAAGVEL